MRYLSVIVGCIISMGMWAQQSNPVELAKQYLQDGKVELAYSTIKAYSATHQDVWTLWLLGTASHALGKYGEARKAFDKALELESDQDEIRIDYANKLIERKLLSAAKNVLSGVKNEEAVYYQNKFLMAQILYWEMSYAKAEKQVNSFLKVYPTNPKAKELLKDILFAKEFKLGLTSGYRIDNQPINTFNGGLIFSKYKNEWLNPMLEVANSFLASDSANINAVKLGIGNSVLIPKVNVYVDAAVGTYLLPSDERLVTAHAQITKSFYNRVKLGVTYNRDRYLYTLGSLDKLVVYDDITPSLAFSSRFFEINLNAAVKLFNDDNQSVSAGGWTLLHVLNQKMIKFNLGYAYSRTQSDFDSYGSIKSMDEIMAFYSSPDYELGMVPSVSGDYLSYYTPLNQEIHSGLINVVFQPIKQLSFSATGSYGFQASEDTPYLYLSADAAGNSAIVKEYTSTDFNPQSLSCKLSWEIKKSASLNVSYQYSEPNTYYNSQTIEAGLLLSF